MYQWNGVAYLRQSYTYLIIGMHHELPISMFGFVCCFKYVVTVEIVLETGIQIEKSINAAI